MIKKEVLILFIEMINIIYLEILDFLVSLIDKSNKNRITAFLKKKTSDKKLIIIDVGAHKGETLKIFIIILILKESYVLNLIKVYLIFLLKI